MNYKPVELETIREKTLEYFNGDELATDAWIRKYSLKDSDDNIFETTPDDMHKRISKELARIDKKYKNSVSEDVFYQSLKNFKYIIPQGSPMSGIGNNLQIVSLSNCFVIGNEGSSDSYGGIMKIDEEQVQLMKRRGGVGHDLGHIRPKGSPVKNSALTSTGVVPFMERYSNSTREVAQDGRRGALMLSIPISHPDAEDFIDAKMKSGKVTGANISVKITDDFMVAVKNNEEYTQSFKFDNGDVFEKTINAKKLWDKIIHNAWASAEPGIMFWDQMIRESLAENYKDWGFANVSTNPCLTGDTIVDIIINDNTESSKMRMKDVVYLFNTGNNIKVKSYNTETNDFEYESITNALLTKKDSELMQITDTESGKIIKCTPDHKILTVNRGYIEAQNLKEDDILVTD